MPVDSTFLPVEEQPTTEMATSTYIEEPKWQRPETSQEKYKRLRVEKRRARAVKNGRKLY